MKKSTAVTMKEILSMDCIPERRYIDDLDHVKILTQQAKLAGYTVGVVGGVWDLPHIGHARYLRLAKEECDILIVVVDSDELVRNRKGPTRPVVPQDERIAMVCHLVSSDIVITRNLTEHLADKEYLNKILSPDVCILSTSTGDISEEQREVISQFAGRIKVFPPQAETSTSARIRLLSVDGAAPLAESVTMLVEEKAQQIVNLLSELPREVHVLVKSHTDKLKEM